MMGIQRYSRHQSSSEGLEEESNANGGARKVGTKSGAHSKQTGEESDDSEEERNQIEGKHET